MEPLPPPEALSPAGQLELSDAYLQQARPDLLRAYSHAQAAFEATFPDRLNGGYELAGEIATAVERCITLAGRLRFSGEIVYIWVREVEHIPALNEDPAVMHGIYRAGIAALRKISPERTLSGNSWYRANDWMGKARYFKGLLRSAAKLEG